MFLKPKVKGFMGKCKFCGKNAGFLRNMHRDCSQRNRAGKKQIVDLVHGAAGTSVLNIYQLEKEICSIADTSFIREHESRRLAYTGWQYAVIDAIKREEFTEENFWTLTRLAKLNQLSKENIWASMIWSRFMTGRRWKFPKVVNRTRNLEHKAAENERRKQDEAEQKKELEKKASERLERDIKRAIQEGIIISIKSGSIMNLDLPKEETPFNLQKSEKLIWVFKNTTYREERVKKRRTHRSYGVSPTVFGLETAGVGILGLTTKHIYFVSSREQFRIRYDKIVTFRKLMGGIAIKQDSVNARTKHFINGEGWFTYELVSALARSY